MPGLAEPGTSPGVAVVIPAYQAARTIGPVWTRVRNAVPEARILVVDDGSTDGTARELPPEDVIRHPQNRGKGAALRTGIARALDDGAEVLVTCDADGQHPPEEIPRLVEPIVGDAADLVLGARARTEAMPLPRRFTNWLSSTLAARIGGVGVPDAQTGFRAFTAALARAVRPSEMRYDFEAAFLLAALAGKWKVASIAIPTIYDGDDSRSHFRSAEDTWKMARVFWQYAGRIVGGAR
ncbi:MAG TPA: glycosyltransferase family 2 protein [Gemmatimonadales bacterium]|jgi:glycosyltransferase involved in cell wall biosynthesis|nr:glycosyltransferase family 2 protein [Gemmatimonadales bacterium]